jgi:hypothetical protein
MSLKYLLWLVSLLFSGLLYSQQDEQHVWKMVEASNGTKFWYDAAKLDTMQSDKFNIWILETHRPPKTIEDIEGEIYRSKTLYCINLTTVKYGILKIQYFDANNTELQRFDYDNPPPPESIKYTYPITEDSILYYLITELYGPKDEKKR